MKEIQLNKSPAPLAGALPLLAWPIVIAALAWVYWPTLGSMAGTWSSDPQYSHGWLVPVFALVLLWCRREQFTPQAWQASWWGMSLILVSVALRLTGSFFYYPWFDMASLLPCLLGMAVLAGGWHALGWSWPGIAFLAFMLPLPHRVGEFMAPALQRTATVASTYLLQTMGFSAFAEGNIIHLNHARVGVVEACGGLSMLIVFVAMATAVAIVAHRPIADRIIILLSSLPIAVVVNVARITVTAILHDQAGQAIADGFHDVAGWLMMPLSLLLLWLELRLLAKLLPENTDRSNDARASALAKCLPDGLQGV